jgi:hypothetical protein
MVVRFGVTVVYHEQLNVKAVVMCIFQSLRYNTQHHQMKGNGHTSTASNIMEIFAQMHNAQVRLCCVLPHAEQVPVLLPMAPSARKAWLASSSASSALPPLPFLEEGRLAWQASEEG